MIHSAVYKLLGTMYEVITMLYVYPKSVVHLHGYMYDRLGFTEI